MKKTTTILMLLFAMNGFAQTQSDTIYFSSMTKVDLAKVYLTEVQRVTKKLNVCAFDSVDGNVPKNKYTIDKFKSVNQKVDEYNKELMIQFIDLIPYADKKDILNAIIYLKGL